MIFQYPNEGSGSFEIPDNWLAQAGESIASSQRESFATFSEKDCLLIPVSEIEPPKRNPGVIGLHEDRAVSVIKALISNTPLPPIEIKTAESASNFKYKVHHGYHRFHVAIAFGFTKLPCVIVEPAW